MLATFEAYQMTTYQVLEQLARAGELEDFPEEGAWKAIFTSRRALHRQVPNRTMNGKREPL